MQYLLTKEEKEKLTNSRESKLAISMMRSKILNAEKTACKEWSSEDVRHLENFDPFTRKPRFEIIKIKHLANCNLCPIASIFLHIKERFGIDGYVQAEDLKKTICPDMELKDVRS